MANLQRHQPIGHVMEPLSNNIKFWYNKRVLLAKNPILIDLLLTDLGDAQGIWMILKNVLRLKSKNVGYNMQREMF